MKIGKFANDSIYNPSKILDKYVIYFVIYFIRYSGVFEIFSP